MAEVTITAKVLWKKNPSSSKAFPLRNVFCSLMVLSFFPTVTTGYLDDEGCIKIKVPTSGIDLAKQFNQRIYAAIALMPNTKDCNVVYREDAKDKANPYTLQADIDLVNNKVDFQFHLNPVEGTKDPNDPKTFLDQCDRRRLVVASIMQFGARFIRNRLGKTPDHVTCYYPKRYKVVDTSYALISIHLAENDYLSPFTILHEYGHKCYGMYRNYTRIPIADHSDLVDLTANHYKTRGIYTAFIEGFASYFSYRVMKAFEECLNDFKETPACLEDAERNYTEYSVHGEANESSISNLFIDMGDPTNAEEHAYCLHGGNVFGYWLVPHEELSIADKAIVNLVAEQDDQNIYSFTKAFYKKYPELTEPFNNILSMQGIAPSGVYATKIDDKEVSIKWVPGGTKESLYYDDDKLSEDYKPCKTYQTNFDISVCDAQFNLLKKYRVNNNESLTFPYNIVESLNTKSNYFLVKIKGYNTINPKTDYESSYFRVDFNSYVTSKSLVVIPSILNQVRESKRTSMTIGEQTFEVFYRSCSYNHLCNMNLRDEDSFFDIDLSEKEFTRVKVLMADRPKGRYIGEKYYLEVEYFNGDKEKVLLESKSTILGKNNSAKFIKSIRITGEKLEEKLLAVERIKFMKNTINLNAIGSTRNPKGPRDIFDQDKGKTTVPYGKQPLKAKKK